MTGRKTQSVATALYGALKEVETTPGDAATVALAKRYAALVDADPASAVKVGPLLLDVLRELGMTPRARAGVVKGGTAGDGGKPRSKLDELRARRAARQHDAATVDATTS